MSEQSSEYVPTTEEIREYVEVGGEPRPWEEPDDDLDAARAAAFDRWLVAHDTEVAEKALKDAADAARAEQSRCGEIHVVSGCYIQREPYGYKYWGEAARALTDRAAALRASSVLADLQEHGYPQETKQEETDHG